jgi:hypothetical protein
MWNARKQLKEGKEINEEGESQKEKEEDIYRNKLW